jgi:hypothetical protein
MTPMAKSVTSDHYQPRKSELIHVRAGSPFAFQSFRICFVVAQERSRATGPGPVRSLNCRACPLWKRDRLPRRSACAKGAAIAHQLCRNSGFATLAAIRRASSRVSSFAADRGPVVLK